MNAVPNSLPNRYCLVENVEVTDNTFIDCSNIEFGTGKDLERTLAPERVLFARNTIVNRTLDAPFIAVDRTDGFTFRDNRVALARACAIEGFENTTPQPSCAAHRGGHARGQGCRLVHAPRAGTAGFRPHLPGAGR